ncbi:MAG TPA: bifunctional phosphoribosylaminoimidazolecarboxamide formyltransferase/IMP cyclohydrolase [Chloroflexota bacterium]|nr:bifunctional phosphoribosylaminoimidazolecarboxamide formyltransferase/IMP cyclohydrolase [Chloroflexota bacterium]
MRAILSPFDKNGLIPFARGLIALGFDLFATDGTARWLGEAGVACHNISELTKHAEMLGGRVKTLHPAIYAGLLADPHLPDHVAQLARFRYESIEVVVVNLYPFRQTVESPLVQLAEAIEQIDIGGVALLRAASKNIHNVIPVVDPVDYSDVLKRLQDSTTDPAWRRGMAAKTFRHVAAYDSTIAGYLTGTTEEFPEVLPLALTKIQDLRYGENPHQRAALYGQFPNSEVGSTLAGATQLHGRELSFNNILDVEAAFSAVRDFEAISVAVIKHGNPCGLASADNLPDAYRNAHAGDPLSSFGGALALNRPVDATTAGLIAESHYDDIVAPGFADDALPLLQRKKNVRILKVCLEEASDSAIEMNPALALDFRQIRGGFLVQTVDGPSTDGMDYQLVTDREPTAAELADLLFAWRAVKHVKSNAIVLARQQSLVGIGAGQMSRVDSVELALRKAGNRVEGSVLASDGFFAFADGVELAASAGIRAIIQPGGSVHDDDITRVANQRGVAMLLTGRRHFRH